MAYYGIPSAGQALTASTANDTITLASLGGTLVTAQSIFGADGNDVISLGALGITATASAAITVPTLTFTGTGGAISGTHIVSGEIVLHVSAGTTYTDTTAYTYNAAGSGTGMVVSAIGVRTSEQGARTVNGALFQANAGQDSIALGDTLTRVSAATFAGGAGNDLIGSYTNVNNQWTVGRISGTYVSTNFEGGNGNDTINLVGDAVYSALNVNSNKGDDLVAMNGTVEAMTKSVVGLGAGNDTLSGEFLSIDSATIAGGKGNDTITVSATTFDNLILGGDRGNAVSIDGDGNDSIYIEGGNAFTASTIYGGGGNDTVTFSAAAMTAVLNTMNKGADVFTATEGVLIKSSTIAMGNQGDEFHVVNSGQILSSRINLGKGLDTTDFGGADVGSAADFGGTTLKGGAGADYLMGSAEMEAGDTNQVVLEYVANSESTLSAFDTVALDVTDSGNYVFRYEPGASAATFNTEGGLTATDGVVTFSSTFATDVTARAEAIASKTTAGQAAAFVDGSSNAYLFVKGSSDNLVVQIGSATVASIASMTLDSTNSAKDITLKIE